MTPTVSQSRQVTLQTTKPKALETMANRLNLDPAKMLGVLKATVIKNATDEELAAFVVVANEYNLNPLTKQIYAFPGKGGGVTPVVSIDGWVHMVNSHPQMDGMEFEDTVDSECNLVSITCSIWRKDRTKPVRVTEYLAECKRNTEPWKMEHRMLRHKALKECARYAFGFSGIHDEDEAIDIAATVQAVPQFSKPRVAIEDAQAEIVAEPAGPIQTQLAEHIVKSGILFDTFYAWAVTANKISEQVGGFSEIPTETAEALFRVKDKVVAEIKKGMNV